MRNVVIFDYDTFLLQNYKMTTKVVTGYYFSPIHNDTILVLMEECYGEQIYSRSY